MLEESIPSEPSAAAGRSSRRDFLKGAAAGIGASVAGTAPLAGTSPATGTAAQPLPFARIDVLGAGYYQPFHDVFRNRLDALGPGRYDVTFYYAEGRISALPAMATALVAHHPRVIVVADTPSALAARDITYRGGAVPEANRIPVVLTIVTNPDLTMVQIPLPLVQSHIKGLADHPDPANSPNPAVGQTREKRVCILQEVLERAAERRSGPIAVIYNADNKGKMRELQIIAAMAVGSATQLLLIPLTEPPGAPGPLDWWPSIESTLQSYIPDPSAVMGAVEVEEPVVFNNGYNIRHWLRDRGIPDMWESVDSLGGGVEGGLFCYGPTRKDAWYWAAQKVHDIVSNNHRPPLPGPQFESLPFRLYYNPLAGDALGIRLAEGELICGEPVLYVPEDISSLPPDNPIPWPAH